jgi:hypothetical protein
MLDSINMSNAEGRHAGQDRLGPEAEEPQTQIPFVVPSVFFQQVHNPPVLLVAKRRPRLCLQVLNAAPAYFDGGLVELRRQGTMHFMSTRNNAFSNRSQKMTIIVGPGKRKPNVPGIIVGSVVAALVVAGGMFWVAAFWVGGAAGGGAGLGAAIIAAR